MSPEKRKLIHGASLDTLKKLYEKCYEERLPRSALINEIEKEIFRKTYNEKTMKIDRIYKLKEFVSNKKIISIGYL